MAEDDQYKKLRDAATKYPNISDSYQYSEQLMKDTCLALHGIILQDIEMGKKELLKDARFFQGRFYETLTYLLSRHDKDLDQVILEYEHPKVKYMRSRTIIQPKVDVMLVKRKPELQFITALMMRKSSTGYEPDVRDPRSDMARLAYMVLERACRWGFYIWIGTLDELRWWELVKNYSSLCHAEGTKESQIVLRRDTLLLPRVGKPLPASFNKTLLVNRIAPAFCIRLYRIEPESTMWEEKDDDVARLYEYYSTKQIHTSYGMWAIADSIRNVRKQVLKVRDYLDAGLFDRARAMLMMAKVMFTDLVVVKQLEQEEIEETDYLKQVMDALKQRVQDGIEESKSSSSSEDD